MKINCDHGYYKFYTSSTADLFRFRAAFGVELCPKQDYFTFEELSSLEPFSLKNQPFGNLTAKASICADYGDLFKANGFVFDLGSKKLAFSEDIKTELKSYRSWSGSLNLRGLPQAGGIIKGKKLLSFSGIFDESFKICEIYGEEYGSL